MTTLPILSQRDTQSSLSRPIEQPQIGKEVQRFAVELRTNGNAGPQVLMIVPVTPTNSVLRLAYETALGLVHINESPVLVIDLQPGRTAGIAPSNARAGGAARMAPFGERDSDQDAAQTADLPTLSVIRPVEDGDPAVYLSSPKFARFVQDARKSFAHILIVAESVLESPAALVAIGLCDGVVLLVKEGEATTTALTVAKQILVRNGAKLLGFLYEKH